MTKEMVELAKTQIIEQAGQSMLSQTRKNTQKILSLLQ
jgi:flagellin-like hook-associated protein FlgL